MKEFAPTLTFLNQIVGTVRIQLIDRAIRYHTSMRDRDVRSALVGRLRSHYAGDDTTRIVEEMGLLHGEVRVDVAVVNGELAGYEIKSPADTLARFARQQELYSRILDRAWLVTTPIQAEAAAPCLPEWWGVMSVENNADGRVRLAITRDAALNPSPDPSAIVELLWRVEALEELELRGLAGGMRSRPRRDLWSRLAGELPTQDLSAIVRQRLKQRHYPPSSTRLPRT